MTPIPLSVLDLSPVPSGGTVAGALGNSVDLARQVEGFGYHRYWLAEHHLASGVAASSPAVLAAIIATHTSRVRVGSGAVLLGATSPLLAAEQFGTIAHLYPGRIDLGLGRSSIGRLKQRVASAAAGDGGAPPPAPGAFRSVDGLVLPPAPRIQLDLARLEAQARLLGMSDDAGDDYLGQVGDILAFLRDDYRTAEGLELHAPTAGGADVQVWVLGSSAGPSSAAAGELGLPYAANYHVAPSGVLDSVAAYREAFRPSPAWSRPHVMVSADVVVAEDDSTANELATPYAVWVQSIRAGEGAMPYPSPAEAARHVWTDDERTLVADRVATQFVGSPATVVEKLRTLQRATSADELLITTITHDHADRVRSYELLAKAWADAGLDGTE